MRKTTFLLSTLLMIFSVQGVVARTVMDNPQNVSAKQIRVGGDVGSAAHKQTKSVRTYGEASQPASDPKTKTKPTSRYGTATLWGGIPKVEELRHAVECGFPWFEADISGIGPNESSMLELKRVCDEAGITLWSAHMPYGGTDISVLDPEEREANMERMRATIRNAAKIGITRLIHHPGSDGISDAERPQRIANAKAGIKELQELATPLGITIMVEDLPRSCLGNTPEELMDLIKGTDAKICFDTNHYERGSMDHFLDVCGSKIGTVHFSDYEYTTGDCHWLPGQGRVVWEEVMCRLDELGYDGVFMSEVLWDIDAETKTKITMEQLKAAYDKMFAAYEECKASPEARLKAKAKEIKSFYFYETSISEAFPAGDDPAFYASASVDAFAELYDNALTATADCDALRLRLDAALDDLLAACHPVTEGYYWIQTAATDFIGYNNIAAMYSDNSGLLKWKAFEPTLQFLFKVEKSGDGYVFRNMYDDTYVGGSAKNSTPIPMTEQPEVMQYAVPFGVAGNMKIYNGLNSYPYHTLSHGGGQGTGSNIVQYGGGAGSHSAWFMRRADEATVEALLDVKVPIFAEECRVITENAEKYKDVVFGYPAARVEALVTAYAAFAAAPKDEAAIEALRQAYNETKVAPIQQEEGVVYRLKNLYHSTYLASVPTNYGVGGCVADPQDAGTLWTLTKSGEDWKLKNLRRDSYLGRISKTSESILFAPTDAGTFSIAPSAPTEPAAFVYNTNTINEWEGDAYVYTQKNNLLAWKGNEAAMWYVLPVQEEELATLSAALYSDLAMRLCTSPVADGQPGTYTAGQMNTLRAAYDAWTADATEDNRVAMVKACRELTTRNERVGLATDKYYRIVAAYRKMGDKSPAITVDLKDNGYVAGLLPFHKEEGTLRADMLWSFLPAEAAGQSLIRNANGEYFGKADVGSAPLTVNVDAAEAASYRFGFNEQGDWIIRNDDKLTLNAPATSPVVAYNSINSRWTIEEVVQVTIDIDGSRYATRCFPFAVRLPEGLTAYIAEPPTRDMVKLVATGSDIVPAHTPVVLFADREAAVSFTCPILYDNNDTPLSPNALMGTRAIRPAPFSAYVLGTEPSGTQFYRLSPTVDMPANLAYLPQTSESALLKVVFDGEPTGIDRVEGKEIPEIYYDLRGSRVTKLESGHIYLNNRGEKFIYQP